MGLMTFLGLPPFWPLRRAAAALRFEVTPFVAAPPSLPRATAAGFFAILREPRQNAFPDAAADDAVGVHLDVHGGRVRLYHDPSRVVQQRNPDFRPDWPVVLRVPFWSREGAGAVGSDSVVGCHAEIITHSAVGVNWKALVTA